MKCLICGMEISLKSINVNKSAFLKSNSDSVIYYCPFCGAINEYIVDGDKMDLLSNNKLNDVELKIIEHAMKLEIFNGDFYKQASELASSKEIKDMFSALSRIEYTHARIHQKLCGYSELPQLNKLDYKRYQNDEELLQQAKLREMHAIHYYNKYEGNIENPNVKVILKELKRVEEEHISLIEK